MDRVVLFSATIYTLFGLAAIFTIGRVLLRWRKLTGAKYTSDDWTSYLTFACVVGLTVANYYQLSNGLGQNVSELDTQTVERFLLWAYIAQHFYIAAIFGTKLSLVLLYLQVFEGKSGFRTMCKILALALVCAFVAFEVVAIVQCLPISFNWRGLSGATATCVDRIAYAYSLESVNIAFNAVLLLLPTPGLLRLHATPLRRIGICAVFLVGLAATAISAVRFKYINGLTTDTNVSWYYSYIGLYSSVEVYLSQICCCMPAMTIILNQSLHGSSRLGSSRKSASTARSQDRESGAVVGIKGIGPSEPEDLEKAHPDDDAASEVYERAPSPTIGLHSHRAWEETISSISQFPVHQVPSHSNRFRRPSLSEVQLETPTEASTEDLQVYNEEDERPLEADSATLEIGIPSIVQISNRRSEPRPQSIRLSTDLTPFTREVKLSASRLNLHSW